MEKLRFQQAIVVEGKYDKNTLSQIVDSLILETGGFALFKDKEQMELLRQVAKKRGLIVFTDSDGAGFMIRNKIISSIPKEQLKHAYIPDIYGKEKRKAERSKEGKLGVEGMSPAVLREALLRCEPLEEIETPQDAITNFDFMTWGLSGGANSDALRKTLLKKLDLPEKMSKKSLLSLLNCCYAREFVEQQLIEMKQIEKEV